MKKNIISVCACLTLLILMSCKKDPVASIPYFFKMKIDGQWKEFDSCSIVGVSQPGINGQTYYHLNILVDKLDIFAGLYVNDNEPINKGMYSAEDKNPAAGNPMAGLGTWKEKGSNDMYITHQFGWPLYEAVVNITAYSADMAEGNFYGQMRLIGGDKVLTVTEGSFRAKRR